jgi:deoxyribodipyrimidine photo-lyase
VNADPHRVHAAVAKELQERGDLELPRDQGRGVGAGIQPGPIPSLADLGLGDVPTANPDLLLQAGESAARSRLERWLARGVADYRDSRDRLDLEDGTSRLSADLHLGLLSPLEVVAVVYAAGRRGGCHWQ